MHGQFEYGSVFGRVQVALLVGVLFFAFFPKFSAADSREIVGFEEKSDRALLLKNVAVPNPASNDFLGLEGKNNVGLLSGDLSKDISFPLRRKLMARPCFDFPTGKRLQLAFFANGRRDSSDVGWRFAIVVDCDDQTDQSLNTVICSPDVIGPARHMGSFRYAHVSDGPSDIERLASQREELEKSNTNKNPGSYDKPSLIVCFIIACICAFLGIWLCFLGGQYFDDKGRKLGAALACSGAVLGLLGWLGFWWRLLL
jgi:hypothetical protein